MKAEEISKKYIGEFPDVHNRKLAKTWEELRLMLQTEIEEFSQSQNSELLDKVRRMEEENSQAKELLSKIIKDELPRVVRRPLIEEIKHFLKS